MELKQRLINGLNKLNLTLEDMKGYRWAGGEIWEQDEELKYLEFKGTYHPYFKQYFPDREPPNHVNFCICGQKIKINNYIFKDTNILILGSSGLLGSEMSNTLKNKGLSVFCADLPEYNLTDYSSIENLFLSNKF